MLSVCVVLRVEPSPLRRSEENDLGKVRRENWRLLALPIAGPLRTPDSRQIRRSGLLTCHLLLKDGLLLFEQRLRIADRN